MKKFGSIILIVAMLSSLFAVNVTATGESTAMLDIYVSPTGNDDNSGTSQTAAFATIERAMQEVENNNSDMTGDIVVHILPGYYQLDEKLVFGPQSGGTNGYDVIYQGEGTDDNPALISGGTQITGWVDTNGDGVWTAPANIAETRTLYINGYPAQRAKSKYLYKIDADTAQNYLKDDSWSLAANGAYTKASDGFKIPAADILWEYAHPEELELVWPLLWTHQRTPVEDVFLDPDDSSMVVFAMDNDKANPYWMWANKKALDSTNPLNLVGASYTDESGNVVSYPIIYEDKNFYIENALELLDEPGEFYFDKTNKQIYYMPYENEDLTTAETYVGTTELMVNIEGTTSDKVKNIVFDNIEFRYGAWNTATTTGVQNTQTDHLVDHMKNDVVSGGMSMPAQFTVNFAQDIEITDCKFIDLGASAIKMENGVSDSLIQGNIIRDVSGTGIMIDSYEHKEDSSGNLPDGQERCDNIQVLNNVIHRVATEFRGMTGISMYLPSNTTVSYNDIKNVPYSGIVAGWGWGNYNSTGATGNVISYNKIQDVTITGHDGGHIYTLDTIPGLEISNNYLVNSRDWRGGIYLDSGSEGYTISNNVIEDSHQWLFARALSGTETLSNITATNNYYDEFSTGQIDTANVTLSSNTEVARNNNTKANEPSWNQTAQNIIANAGLQTAYEGLLTDADLPDWRTDVLAMQPQAGFKDEESLWISGAEYTSYSDGSLYKFPSSVVDLKYVPVRGFAYDEWVEYTVDVDKTMEYNFQMYGRVYERLNSENVVGYRYIDIYVDDVLKQENVLISGDGYDTYDLGSLGTISAGEHRIKVVFSGDSVLTKFRLYNTSYYNDVTYDEGAEIEPDVIESDTAEVIGAGLYQTNTAIQTGTIASHDFTSNSGADTSTSDRIIMQVGDWAEWTIDADEAGMCDITLLANGWYRKNVESSGGTTTTETDKVRPYVKLTVNGTVLGEVYITNSDGASSSSSMKETLLPSFEVNKGTNTIRLEATGNKSVWQKMAYEIGYGGKMEAESYDADNSVVYKNHSPEGRVTMQKGNYATYTLSPGKAGKYQLKIVANSSQSSDTYPSMVTLEVNGTEIGTTTLNRDGAHNDCLNYPCATVLAEVNLNAANNTIKLTDAGTDQGWDYISYQICEVTGNGTIECENYTGYSGGPTTSNDGKRVTVGADRYLEWSFPETTAGLYELKLIANSYSANPQVTLSVIKNSGTASESITDIGTVDLESDGLHNDCITYPLTTYLPILHLDAGDVIRVSTVGVQSCWDRIDYSLLTETETIASGTYTAILGLGDYDNATFIAAVYDENKLLSATHSSTVENGLIIIDGVSVTAGQTVKLFVWDDIRDAMKPLEDVKIYY